MKYHKSTRRYFLQGLGGSLLSLPLLPSLIPRAMAQALPADKFLVMLGTNNGGYGENGDYHPFPVLDDENPVLKKHTFFNTGGMNGLDHIIRYANLNQLLTTRANFVGKNLDGGTPKISYSLGSFLNPYINKMNFYRGIDGGTFYSGHNRGICSGNIADVINNTEAAARMEDWPSLDQFLANSNKFYTNPDSISLKYITQNGHMSQAADGTRLPDNTGYRIDRLYHSLFDKYDKNLSPSQIAQREKKDYLVDRVYKDYKRFLSGAHGPAKRISSVDKIRVEEHVANLFDIQKKYKNFVSSCGDVTGPKSKATSLLGLMVDRGVEIPLFYDLLTDLIASSFYCGATRLANIWMPDYMTEAGPYSGDYHGLVHSIATSGPEVQARHNEGLRWQARHVLLPLIQKLDSLSAPGQTGSLLDNGLVTWTHECGPTTHQHPSLGYTTFGGLGGYFKTGLYVDFRNTKNMGLLKYAHNPNKSRPGLPIQGMWANILNGFGYDKSEYERHGKAGYGDTSENDYPRGDRKAHLNHQPYPPRLMNSLSDKLPIVT